MEQTKQFKLAHFNFRLDEIWNHNFLCSESIDSFDSFAENGEEQNGAPVPEVKIWKSFVKGERWISHNNYLWLKKVISIPAEWKGQKIGFALSALCYSIDSIYEPKGFGLAPLHEPKWLGFEGLLYLNGVPYHGIDNNHQLIFFPDSVIGTDIEIAIRVWTGTDPTSNNRQYALELNTAKFGPIDSNAVDFYMLGSAILDTIREIPETDQYHPSLFNMLDEAVKRIDFSDMPNKDLRENLKKAYEYLYSKFCELSKHKYHIATDYAIGHTHLDVAWLWQLHQLTEKTARSWLTALRWMDLDPEFTFLQTQPQLYADIKKHYPVIFEQVKQRVKEGRWCAEGSMWVEADCNLSSGEALSRQFLYGKRFYKEEFGIDTKTLWLPDVFGYSYALPQILNLTEIETFITSKISWNQYNRFPHDIFKWRGMGGYDILTTFIVVPEPKPRENWYYTYNGEMTAEAVHDAWEAFIDKDICSTFVHPYGYGDGGSGTTFKQLKTRQYLKKMPSLANLKDSTLQEFNKELHKDMDSKNIPVYSGELYLEYHRGTYTSQALIKKNNRKTEFALAQLEMLHAANFLATGTECDKDAVRSCWHVLLKNQFHDILPGSSIHAVYEDSAREFENLRKEVASQTSDIVSSLFADDSQSLVVFNPLSHERKDVLKIATKENLSLEQDGRILAQQRVEGETWFGGLKTSQMGFTKLSKVASISDSAKKAFEVTENSIKSDKITLTWNKYGQIDSLVFNKTGFNFVEEGKALNILEMLEDKPRRYDAWEFEPYAEEKTDIVTDFLGVKLISVGELAAVVRFSWKYNKSTIEQDMIVYADSDKIDFDTKVEWNERNRIFRTAFYTNVVTNKATYDIQYGNVERPTHRNTSWDVARFEVAAHKWADIADRGHGLSILNESKYGYSAHHNCLRLTFLKSAQDPDPTADAGFHRFTYSILPHEDSWLEANTHAHALDLNSPCHVFDNKSVGKDFSLVSLAGEKVFLDLDACKLAEDDNTIIVRFHEYAGKQSSVSVNTCFTVKSWQKVNILENAIEDMQTGAINLTVKPYEIVTLKLTL